MRSERSEFIASGDRMKDRRFVSFCKSVVHFLALSTIRPHWDENAAFIQTQEAGNVSALAAFGPWLFLWLRLFGPSPHRGRGAGLEVRHTRIERHRVDDENPRSAFLDASKRVDVNPITDGLSRDVRSFSELLISEWPIHRQ